MTDAQPPNTPADLILEILAEPEENLRRRDFAPRLGAGTADSPEGQVVAKEIMVDLLAQALATSGVRNNAEWEVADQFSSGNTAEWVGRLDLTIPCVLKLDKAYKLVEEALALREARERRDLPEEFRECLPRIYAIRDAPPLFAYLMERFPKPPFADFDELLFTDAGEGDGPRPDIGLLAGRLTNRLLDLLLNAYRRSRNTRLRPSISADYVDRIRGRLLAAASADESFLSRRVYSETHDRTYKPWQDYLRALTDARSKVEAIAPPFTTFVHGDPNPENVLGRVELAGVDVRFIDVKEWHNGDYLFDIAKYLHYLIVTGPVEKLCPGQATADYTLEPGRAVLRHHLPTPGWVADTENIVRQRVGEFARMFGDTGWEDRLTLGLASNLLGLPAGRLPDRRVSALICYVEGLRYLDDFCQQEELLD